MDEGSSPTELARTIFEALAQRDINIIDRADHPEAVGDFVAIGVMHGRGEIRALFEEIFAAMPDFSLRVDNLLGDEEHAVVQWTATGSFTGKPFRGIHATGRKVSLRGCDVMRFEGGLLRHNTIYYDGLAFSRNIGLLPTEGSAGDTALTAAFNAATDVRTWINRRWNSMTGR